MRLSKSIIGQEEANSLAEVILNVGYLGMGEEVVSFEQELGVFLAF